MSSSRALGARHVGLLVVLALLIVLPTFGSQFFVNFVVTRALILGLVASTIVLTAFGRKFRRKSYSPCVLPPIPVSSIVGS